MKIAIVNKTDKQGGAAIAAFRLKNALTTIGVEVIMLVQKKLTRDVQVKPTRDSRLGRNLEFMLFVAERLYFYFYEKSRALRFAFSPAFAGENISRNRYIKDADIIHLHWFNQGYLSLKSLEQILKLNKPVVWTLHDMWAFTGGCHYSGECENFKYACGNCKFIRQSGPNDLSDRIFRKKQKILENAQIEFVTCSEWLAGRARESTLLRNAKIQSIPNPIDTTMFYPKNKQKTRDKLGLPPDKKLALFGAANIMDERKGLKYLLSALHKLKEEKSGLIDVLEIVLFGKSDENFISQIPFKIHDKGLIYGDLDIIDIYNAADIFVLPSLEDNLPNTIMESMACGTPVLAFNIGGIPEMIDHQVNGYLVEYKSVEDLKSGMEFLLFHSGKSEMSRKAVEKVSNFYHQEIVAVQYQNLYKSLLEINQKPGIDYVYK